MKSAILWQLITNLQLPLLGGIVDDLAKVMGFELMENFKRPYFAKSISQQLGEEQNNTIILGL